MPRPIIWISTIALIVLAGCQYLVDSTGPRISFFSPAAGVDTVATGSDVSVSVVDTDSGLASVFVLFGPAGEDAADPGVIAVELYEPDAENRYQTTSDVITAPVPVGVLPGDYVITVEAKNGFGVTSMASREVSVVPGESPLDPTVAWVSPVPDAIVAGTVTLEASASDPDGTVAKVEFFVDTNEGTILIGSATTGDPYTVEWDTNPYSDTEFTLRAVATDGAGNTGEASLTVTVDNGLGGTAQGMR